MSTSHGLLKRKDTSELPAPWSGSGPRAEPTVVHGYTLTKEIPFRDVCSAIRDAAFVTRCVNFALLTIQKSFYTQFCLENGHSLHENVNWTARNR